MTHLLRRVFMLALFVWILGGLGYVQGQPAERNLKPQSRTLTGSAFTLDSRRGITAGPDGITTDTPIGTAETAETAAPATFTYLMLRWRATASEPDLVNIQVRASEDGQTWTVWGEAHENEDLIDPREDPDVHWSSAIYTGPANFWQLRVTLLTASDGSAPVLHEVQVNTVDSRGPDPTPRQPAGATPAGALAQPAYIPRADWGGSEVLNNSVAPTWYRATHLVLHHTADANSLRSSESTWADRVRATWSFHTYSRGWGDVGYNWLVSPKGVLYEGRNGSSRPDQDSVGFHDTGNKGSMGVVMLGTFGPGVPNVEPITPSAEAQDGVVRIFAWKASQRGIDPLASGFYYGCSISSSCAPYSPGSVVRNIAGHRDVTPRTSCPGDLAMGVIDSIRTRVQNALTDQPPPPPPPTATPTPRIEEAELLGVQYESTQVEDGGAIRVRFTVRNTGNVALETQGPPPGRTNDILPGHVYDENECFIGDGNPSSYPPFHKEDRRLRVVLGGIEGETALGAACAGNNGGYPWRWGLEGPLQPGETRTVVGYVRFRNPTNQSRAIRLRPALVLENFRYLPSSAGETTISVMPEQRAPQVSVVAQGGMPLASVYRLLPTPWELIYRFTEPSSVQEGEFLGTIPWDGSTQDWGSGGPLGQTDGYVVTQARPFFAPEAGTYSFELTSDDGSWLWVDGLPVVSNSGLHKPESVSGSIWLPAGVHTLGIKYVDYVGAAYARYSWRPWGSRVYESIPIGYGVNVPQRGIVFGPGTQVAMVADDLGGSGVREIRYAVDGNPEQNQAGARLTLSLPDGSHVIKYRAIDNHGLESPERETTMRVDTVPPETTLHPSILPDGMIWLNWSSSSDAILFEIEYFDSSTGIWSSVGTVGNNSRPFFGIPGHTYQFRIRGWDGVNWETTFKESPQMLTVPADAVFPKVYMPIMGK